MLRHRSRSRSRDRQEAKRPKIPLNKWDEGLGGAYVPPSGSYIPPTSASLPALTGPNQASAVISLPTVGEASQRRVIVGNIPKDQTQPEISQTLSKLIVPVLPPSSESAKQPVLSVQFLTLSAGLRSVMVELRTPLAAAACMRLSGVISDGQKLTTRRPRDFQGTEPDITEEAELADESTCPVPVHSLQLFGFPSIMGIQEANRTHSAAKQKELQQH